MIKRAVISCLYEAEPDVGRPEGVGDNTLCLRQANNFTAHSVALEGEFTCPVITPYWSPVFLP